MCFNCGSPNHAVASCPVPIDRQLVSLSRQLFQFLHPDLVAQETTRFHVAEGWKQQRLEWLRSYEPGVIRGPPLRDALGLQEGDPGDAVEWLRGIAYWGYPPGWVGSRDPRQLICSRILEDEGEEWDSFTIFGGADDDEEIDLGLFSLWNPTSLSSRAANSSMMPTSKELWRWATYPDTFFSSKTLSVYNGEPLDRMTSRASVTFTAEGRALWERILSGGLASSVSPWRMPGAFGAWNSSATSDIAIDFVPPPPSVTPPPLPLTQKSPLYACAADKNGDGTNDELVVDMDMESDGSD